jgi:hypothetical protein
MFSYPPRPITTCYQSVEQGSDEGGGKGVGDLLVAKGGGCNLDAGACDSMVNQQEEEVPTVDICESPGRRPGHEGWEQRSGG